MLGYFFRFLNIFPPKKALGALPNALDLRDIQLSTFQKPVELPYEYMTDISMLPVMDQKGIGSCVGQAEGLIISYFDYLENRNVDVSKRYVYAKSKLIDGIPDQQGTYPRVAASVIAKNGSPRTSFVPDDNDLPYSEYVSIPGDSAPLVADAKTRKASYVTTGVDLNSLKQAIYQNKLVSVSLVVDWNAFPNTGKLTAPNPKNMAGLHRVVLFGFRGNEFFGRNSWSDKWGMNGNFSFQFLDYAPYIYDPLAYTDVPNEILEDAKNKTYSFTRTLRIGMSGADVTKLQEILSVTPRTGYFGPITQKKVMQFQSMNGLAPDGIVGPKTIEKLNKPIFMLSPLESAIIQVESQGDLYAIGDKHLTDKAYGCMQIRKPCVTDVNNALGKTIKAEDTLGNLNLSVYIFREYQKIYNPNGSDEEKARTWNGGPGWRRNPALTDRYWSAVKKLL